MVCEVQLGKEQLRPERQCSVHNPEPESACDVQQTTRHNNIPLLNCLPALPALPSVNVEEEGAHLVPE